MEFKDKGSGLKNRFGETAHIEAEKMPSRKRRTLPRWTLPAGLVAAVILIIGLVLWHPWQPSHIPKSILIYKKSVTFPLYYPNSLPDGFQPEAGKVSVTDGVLLFNFTYDNNKQVAVSEQPKPNNIDFNDIVGLPRDPQTALVRSGQATYATVNNRTIANLITDKTWLIINAPQGLDNDRMKTLLSAFREVK